MKLGLVCPYNMFRPGGVQAVIEATARDLRGRGHTVKIIAPQPKEATYQDPDLILLGQSTEFNTPFATKGDLAMSIDPSTIDAMFEREQFDVVHFHEPWVPMLSMQLLARSPAVNVGTFHAKLPDTPLSKSIEKIVTPYTRTVFKRLKAISAVSQAATDFVASVTDMPLTIIPNGIDLQHYDPEQYKSLARYKGAKKTILYIGRLEKRKGAQFLLPAYKQLAQSHSNIRLVIAGDGGKRKTLEQYVEKEELPNVEFLGFVSDEDKLRLLKSADLFVSPAIYGESFGIVLLEAMAMNVPVVAGNNPGYTSVMVDRGRISLVDPKDVDAFAQRLELLLFDEEVRGLWQEWARDYVQQFDWPKVTDQYEALYKKALRG